MSDIPGTTRDAIDSLLEIDKEKFLLIDTAGIKRKGKTAKVLEKFSVIMALKALDRCDVAVIFIDGLEGITDQDATIDFICFRITFTNENEMFLTQHFNLLRFR